MKFVSKQIEEDKIRMSTTTYPATMKTGMEALCSAFSSIIISPLNELLKSKGAKDSSGRDVVVGQSELESILTGKAESKIPTTFTTPVSGQFSTPPGVQQRPTWQTTAPAPQQWSPQVQSSQPSQWTQFQQPVMNGYTHPGTDPKVQGQASYSDRRCMWKMIRGRSKGENCPGIREPGSDYCKQCASKKGATGAKPTPPGLQGGFPQPGGFPPMGQYGIPPMQGPPESSIPQESKKRSLTAAKYAKWPGKMVIPGSKIVFHKSDQGSYKAFGVEVAGGKVRRLTDEDRRIVADYGLSEDFEIFDREKGIDGLITIPGEAPPAPTSYQPPAPTSWSASMPSLQTFPPSFTQTSFQPPMLTGIPGLSQTSPSIPPFNPVHMQPTYQSPMTSVSMPSFGSTLPTVPTFTPYGISNPTEDVTKPHSAKAGTAPQLPSVLPLQSTHPTEQSQSSEQTIVAKAPEDHDEHVKEYDNSRGGSEE